MKASGHKQCAVINLQGKAQEKGVGDAINSNFIPMQAINTQIHENGWITYQVAAAWNKGMYWLRKQRVRENIRINET